jgi:hypothetical protein
MTIDTGESDAIACFFLSALDGGYDAMRFYRMEKGDVMFTSKALHVTRQGTQSQYGKNNNLNAKRGAAVSRGIERTLRLAA